MKAKAKKEALKLFLDLGLSPIILIDITYLGVDAPLDWLEAQGKIEQGRYIALQVGYNLAIPIPDLTLTDEGWSATLSFDSTFYRCVVPWEATRRYETDYGFMFWSEEARLLPVKETPKPAKPHLRLIK